MKRQKKTVTGYCAYCGKAYAKARSTARYCSDVCRVKFNRAQKAINPTKYERLVMSIQDSIRRLEKASKIAEEQSHDMARPIKERLTFIAMFREKQAIANELKLLLEMSDIEQEPSHQAKISAIYDVDPVNYD